MSPDPNRARQIFEDALRISDRVERTAYLDRECDAEMRILVDGLLAAFEQVGGATAASVHGTLDFKPNPENSSKAFHTTDDATSAFDAKLETDAVQRASQVGDIIDGKYRLVEVIGEGGMGSVFLAQQDEPVKREVALKLIKKGSDSKTVVARFEAERQALALMDHPNIARVYDGGTTSTGQPFFVMELVRGEPITIYCDKNRLSPKDRLELFVQVCRAVQHAHQKGIIHRDLKPGNILVTVVDGRPTPKVIDFGVAKAVEQPLTESAFSEEGVIVGTPAYMSPEQAHPSMADIDTRTDVYALGVVLYELLTGSPPISPTEFRRRAIAEMLRMVREVEPEHLSTKASSADALPNIAASRGLEPSQLLSFLRGDVDWIVLKALEKDRERRYESANGIAADILRYLANEPVAARAPTRWYRLRKFVRRNRGAVGAASLIALVVVFGVIGIIVQWRQAVYERNQKEIARADAEKNLQAALQQRRVALDTVGEMVTAVRSELSNVPNSQRALAAIVGIARKRLDSIIQNPFVEISLNDTTRAMLHDFKGRSLITTGNSSAALAEFKQAIGIFEEILAKTADGPDKEVVKKNLVIELLMSGQASLATVGQAEARVYFERAAQLLEGVADKGSADYRKILVALYMNMGNVTIDRKPREARENYRGAVRVAEDLAKQEKLATGTVSDDNLRNLQQSYSALGNAENRVRNDKAGQEAYDKALAIVQGRQQDKPDDNLRNQELAHITERIGDARLRSNKPADAAKQFAAAAALFRPIAKADQENDDALRDLGRIVYSQGLAAARTGEKAAAAQYFRESLEVRKKRRMETVAQRDLMMSQAQVGLHGEATQTAEKVRAKLPKDPDALIDIACCYAVCSSVVPAAGADKETHDRYVAKALEAFNQAIDAGYGDKVNLETEPDLDAIRDRVEFKEMLKRVPEP